MIRARYGNPLQSNYFAGQMNGLPLLLFVTYLLIATWLITRTRHQRKTGLSPVWLGGLFLLKVFTGVLYGYIYSFNKETADTWHIFQFSLQHYQLLISSPSDFLTNWTADATKSSSSLMNENIRDLFGSEGSFWNELKDLIIIKIEALFNLLSFGNYYINVILYTFVSFGGYVAFYRGLLIIYPGSRLSSLIAAFLIPSCLFWTSGMYKDGILFMLLGYLFYQMALGAREKKMSFPSAIILLFLTACIFVLRLYIALVLLPCLTAWWLSLRSKTPGWLFAAVFTAGTVLFFMAAYLHPGLDFPAYLSLKRGEFLQLTANTALPAGPLEPSLSGYFRELPRAFNYGFLRPYLWENKGLIYIPFALELVAFYTVLIWYLVKKRGQSNPIQYSFYLFALYLLISNWLLLGYIVPITGALIRYKSLFIPFLAAHLLYFLFPRINTLKNIRF